MDLVVRKVSLDLHRSVVLKTPVDTGRARANWQAGVNIAPSGSLHQEDKTGSATIDTVKRILAAVKAGDVIWIVNNVEYITHLEKGSSKQAPAGMMRVTLRNYPGIVEKSVNGAKRERP